MSVFGKGGASIAKKHNANAEDTKQALLKKKAAEAGYIENVDADVVVIEKNNWFQFTIKTFGAIIRLVANIAIVSLAVVGVIALVYPEPRAELQVIFYGALDSLRALIG